MRRMVLLCAATAAIAFAAPAQADEVRVADPTPTGAFSQGSDQGYVYANTSGVVRVCNESPAYTDSASGYIWVNPSGEGTTPTYGTAQVGAGDYDGQNTTDTTRPNDCP